MFVTNFTQKFVTCGCVNFGMVHNTEGYGLTAEVILVLTGALAWNADMLSSGSRDRLILQRDIRTPSVVPERKLTGHRQEVGFLRAVMFSPSLAFSDV